MLGDRRILTKYSARETCTIASPHHHNRSGLRSFLLLVGLLPVTAFAVDSDVAKIGGTEYATMQAAIDAARDLFLYPSITIDLGHPADGAEYLPDIYRAIPHRKIGGILPEVI